VVAVERQLSTNISKLVDMTKRVLCGRRTEWMSHEDSNYQMGWGFMEVVLLGSLRNNGRKDAERLTSRK
jgi:hypothetical protein